MSFRSRMRRRDRRVRLRDIHAAQTQTRFWMRMMWICLFLGVLAAYSFISTLDLEEGLNAAQRCNEMVALYQQTDGVYGWPNCDHLRTQALPEQSGGAFFCPEKTFP